MIKKHLGQNWLHKKEPLEKIVRAGEIKQGETVIEIGPGTGYLTKELLEASARVLAIEKDTELIEKLTEKFSKEIKQKKLTIISDDILKTDLDKISGSQYKVIANIPYNITGAILEKIWQTKKLPQLVVILMQKEVAERIVAKDKKESILSLSIKAYGKPKIAGQVKRGNFFPVPKVDSAILKVEDINRDFFKEFSESEFFTVIKKGFGQKRKQLKNNLNLSKEILNRCNLSENIRAEDLTLSNWKDLIINIKND